MRTLQRHKFALWSVSIYAGGYTRNTDKLGWTTKAKLILDHINAIKVKVVGWYDAKYFTCLLARTKNVGS